MNPNAEYLLDNTCQQALLFDTHIKRKTSFWRKKMLIYFQSAKYFLFKNKSTFPIVSNWTFSFYSHVFHLNSTIFLTWSKTGLKIFLFILWYFASFGPVWSGRVISDQSDQSKHGSKLVAKSCVYHVICVQFWTNLKWPPNVVFLHDFATSLGPV